MRAKMREELEKILSVIGERNISGSCNGILCDECEIEGSCKAIIDTKNIIERELNRDE